MQSCTDVISTLSDMHFDLNSPLNCNFDNLIKNQPKYHLGDDVITAPNYSNNWYEAHFKSFIVEWMYRWHLFLFRRRIVIFYLL